MKAFRPGSRARTTAANSPQRSGTWMVAGLAMLALSACAPAVSAEPYPSQSPEPGEAPVASALEEVPAGVVRFFDREIDLRPILTGFPYRSFDADVEHGRLFYVDARERYTLRWLPLDGESRDLDLAKGQAITNVDWSTRSLWGVEYIPARKELWLHADAANDEKMNLWVLDASQPDAAPVQRTQADYVYAFGTSPDQTKIAYLPRTGDKAPYRTCLRLLDLESGDDREITCDDDALRFTWGRPIFSPDGRELFFNAQVQGDRTRVQLVRVDLAARKPKAKPITDPKVSRSSPGALRTWVGDELIFVANDDGYRNLYAYSRKRKRVRQVTKFTEDIQGAAVLEAGIFVSHGSPAGSTLELIDPKTGEAKVRGAMPGKVSVLGAFGDRALWSHRAPDTVFELLRTRVAAKGIASSFDNTRVAAPSPELNAHMVHCQAEAVRIPTFDRDPATQQARELHAFLLRPKAPIGPEEGAPRPLAMIRSFYGGDNVYTRFDHIMCAAGITVLSPAVRGSSGFGKDFAALNNRDLGGDEIVDLIYAARWLEAKLGLRPEQIGVYGRSHGGYATMRALTFDPATNGRNESYDFGFGLADAGFSDIVAFHDATNIPDWVVLESGDPAVPEDRERMLARSPLYGVERLRAPIFLLHGDADWRVPVEGSRAFAAAAKKLDKPVTYVEVAGQGHHVEGVDRIAANYQARFDFLMSLPISQPTTDGKAATRP